MFKQVQTKVSRTEWAHSRQDSITVWALRLLVHWLHLGKGLFHAALWNLPAYSHKTLNGAQRWIYSSINRDRTRSAKKKSPWHRSIIKDFNTNNCTEQKNDDMWSYCTEETRPKQPPTGLTLESFILAQHAILWKELNQRQMESEVSFSQN